jgi:hypothetical protein
LGEYINFFYPLVTHTLQSPSLNGSDIELHEGGEMRKVSLLIGLALFTLAGSARAQDEAPAAAPAGDTAAAPAGDTAAAPAPAPEAAPAPAPAAAVSSSGYALNSLTLGAGTFQATVPVVLNLSKSSVLKPVWVPLDLSYGVTDQLTVFINHATPNGAIASEGGLCLGGKDRGCTKANGDSSFYNNVNVGAQFSFLKNNGIELSGIGALQFRTLDPMWLDIDVGVGFKYVAAPISVKVTPQIGIGANKRSEGNKQNIAVPLEVAFQAAPQLAVFLDSGIFAETTEHFSDVYTIPVGIGAAFAALPNLDVGAEFMLPRVKAPKGTIDDAKGFNVRVLGVFASYRMN